MKNAIAVNKNLGRFAPSESFLAAHLNDLPGAAFAAVGPPGMRSVFRPGSKPPREPSASETIIRKLLRVTRVQSREQQDTAFMRRMIESEEVRVVLAEYGPSAISVLDACTTAGIPLVAHFHGWDAYVLAPQDRTRRAYARLFAEAHAIIAVSQHMKHHLIQLGAPADRTIWTPCGAVIPARQASPDAAPPNFVTIGRPAPKKATAVTLLAFAHVHRRLPQARLTHIGAEPDPATAQLARALGIHSNVTFLGPQPHSVVLETLLASRCYLHPSVTAPDGDMEGTPVSVLEAMACALPVVSTQHGGILDIFQSPEPVGALVPEYDVDGTAEAMLTYAENPLLAAVHGATGRDWVEKHWSMTHSLSRLEAILSAVATGDSAQLSEMASITSPVSWQELLINIHTRSHS